MEDGFKIKSQETTATKAAEQRERVHRKEYENAMQIAGVTGPTWDDLTEKQRQSIREENRRYWQEMQDLGSRLSNSAGTLLKGP